MIFQLQELAQELKQAKNCTYRVETCIYGPAGSQQVQKYYHNIGFKLFMFVKYSEQNYAAVCMQPRLNLIFVIIITIVLDLYLNTKGIKYTHPSMSLVLKKRHV